MAAERAADPADTLAAFRSVLTATATPPAPLISRIVEEYVHGEDIRRPLGIAQDYPIAPIRPAIEYFAKDRFAGARDRLAGLALTAIDADFAIGSGPTVKGAALSLLLAASGRTSALAELAGPGVETLAQRANPSSRTGSAAPPAPYRRGC